MCGSCDGGVGDGRAEIQHWDVLEFGSATFRKVNADACIKLINNHAGWWRVVSNVSSKAAAAARGIGRPYPARDLLAQVLA